MIRISKGLALGWLALASGAGLALAEDMPVTKGPNGEVATPAASLTLSPEEVEKVKAGNYTAAFAWHELYDWSAAVAQGAKDEFAALGISVIAETNADFDAARQQSDVETIAAMQPTILISLPVDPSLGAATYRAAKEAGSKIVFIDNAAAGFEHGADYVTTVSADLVGIGVSTSTALNEAMGGTGKIGYIFHDADFPVTNQRDQAFRWMVENRFTGLEIVAEAGMADPALIEEIAHGMLTQHPEITGLYVPWAEPAVGVLSTLRQLGREDVKIVTIDLNEPAALDMVQGGAVKALIADEAYDIGRTAARAAAASLLGREVDPFLAVGSLAVTKDNLAEGWKASLGADLPPSLQEALP